jgi:hypothetical protein
MGRFSRFATNSPGRILSWRVEQIFDVFHFGSEWKGIPFALAKLFVRLWRRLALSYPFLEIPFPRYVRLPCGLRSEVKDYIDLTARDDWQETCPTYLRGVQGRFSIHHSPLAHEDFVPFDFYSRCNAWAFHPGRHVRTLARTLGDTN